MIRKKLNLKFTMYNLQLKIKKILHSKLYILHSQTGFSLVEVVVIIAVAGMIVLFLGNLPSSLGLIGSSKQETVVNQIINEEIERLRSLGHENISPGTSTISDSRITSLPNSTSEVLIEDCPPSLCSNGEQKISQVTITISWTSSGKPKKIEVKTLVTEGGLK